jgi:hypothetical protein
MNRFRPPRSPGRGFGGHRRRPPRAAIGGRGAAAPGVEFIFLTTFVLMNQKHQMGRTEQWAHLDLRLSMLAEQEVTKNMEMLRLNLPAPAATRAGPGPGGEGADRGRRCPGPPAPGITYNLMLR